MRPLMIAMNHTRLASGGGVEGYIESLLRHVLDRGHSVDFFCGKVSLELQHPRLRIIRLPYVRSPRILRVASFALLSHRFIAREGRRRRYDVIQGFSRTYYHDLYRDGSGCRRDYRELYLDPVARTGLRKLYYRLDPTDLVVRIVEHCRYVTRPQKLVVAISRFVRDQILRRHPVRPETVRVLYSGVDCTRFTPQKRELGCSRLGQLFPAEPPGPACRYLAFVGNDYQRKGLSLVFDALSTLLIDGGRRPPDFRLFVAGGDPDAPRYERKARELGLSGRVAFLGQRTDVPELLAGADVLLLPSHFDAFANVGTEAFASGLPVIVSPTAGLAELVDPGVGWILEKNTADDLVRALGAFFAVADLGSYRERARTLALDLSWERHYRSVDSLYHELATMEEGS